MKAKTFDEINELVSNNSECKLISIDRRKDKSNKSRTFLTLICPRCKNPYERTLEHFKDSSKMCPQCAFKQAAIHKSQKLYCIYIHTNKINNKKYVGITAQSASRRWRHNGIGYQRNKHFWNAIQKYSWNNFKHEIILENETLEYACKVEKCLIRHYKSNNPLYGYNNSDGGDCSNGFRMNDSTKEKIKLKNSGKKLSDEQKYKIGIGNSKKIYCLEYNKIFNSMDEASKELNIAVSGISMCCHHKADYAGSHPITHKHLHWCFEAEMFENMCIYHFIYSNRKPIYCIELKESYESAYEAGQLLKINPSHIYRCCEDPSKTCGTHPITKKRLHWVYEIDKYKNYKFTICNCTPKSVRCIELDKYFVSLTEASKITGISESSISRQCRNLCTYAGIDENTGTKLHWEYTETIKEKSNE